MHRFSRKDLAAAIVLGVVGMAAMAGSGYGQDANVASEVHFFWAFGAMVGPEGQRELAAVDRDRTLHTGDRLKFMIAHQTPCFIYLFHLSDGNELTCLYPRQFESTARMTDTPAFVPPDNLWFALDEETGTEKFYLLASSQRLDAIEKLYQRLDAAETGPDRRAIVASITETIKDLRRRHLRNTGPVERPIRLGGGFRGIDEEAPPRTADLETIAVEIRAANFYSRTFTIDHR
jgi:hypothetical protein